MTTFHGPVATGLYRLMSLKAQLKLEEKGMCSSGGPIRPRIAAEFNLPKGTARRVFIAKIDAKLEEFKSQLQPGDITK